MRPRIITMAGLAAGLILTATPALAYEGDPAWGERPARNAGPDDPGEMFGLDVTPDTCGETRTANQALGGLLGGVVGGLIGSGIGKGSGRTAATIGGTVLGALGGAVLGTRVADANQRCLDDPGRADDPEIF